MEREYKWDFPKPLEFTDVLTHPRLREDVRAQAFISMRSIYYDTPDQFFLRHHGALRMRQENMNSICCMKLLVQSDGAYTTREEYEVAALNITHGLERLPNAGAPEHLCAIVRKKGVVELCQIQFIRNCVSILAISGEKYCESELAFDEGFSIHLSHRVPIRELEFEYKSGDLCLFYNFADWIENEFSFRQQPLSKLARALHLQ